MLYVGIDVGTGSAKLLLINENGEIKKSVIKKYPISFPRDGWAEQNPQGWWEQIYIGLQELLAEGEADKVVGIGVAGQMHGLVALDCNDQVIRPAILWNDSRNQAEVDYLNCTIGKDKLTEYTANIAFAGFTAPKLLWMKKYESEKFSRIAKVMLPKDYIVYKLTGIHSCDPSDASGTLLYDVAHRCWSEPMLDICSMTRNQMPTVYESFQAVGTVKSSLTRDLGLRTNVIVCAGAGDNAAAAVGCGTVGNGKCNLSLGTSGTIFITSTKFFVDPQNALHSFAHADGGYHQMGCIMSAAACNQWWMDILVSQDYNKEQQCIHRLGENNIFYLPYLVGERSPHNDTNARSAFIGMNINSRRSDMTQAVLEGVAFAIRDCIEAVRAQGITITKSTICGGGTKSMLWNKICSNVLDISLARPRTEQGPAYGAAILAAVSIGQFKSIAQCCSQWVIEEDAILPEPVLVDKYNLQYSKWRKLYPALKEFFNFAAQGLTQ